MIDSFEAQNELARLKAAHQALVAAAEAVVGGFDFTGQYGCDPALVEALRAALAGEAAIPDSLTARPSSSQSVEEARAILTRGMPPHFAHALAVIEIHRDGKRILRCLDHDFEYAWIEDKVLGSFFDAEAQHDQ